MKNLFRSMRLLGLVFIVSLFAACAGQSSLPVEEYGQDTNQNVEQKKSEAEKQVEVLPFDGGAGSASGLLDDEMHDYSPIIYFDYDQDSVNELGQKVLRFYANRMLENSDMKVVLEGHTDERGTPSYNLALGERRAKSVEEVMVLYGVSLDRITIISFGEEAPVAYGHDEDAWGKNRRVELKF